MTPIENLETSLNDWETLEGKSKEVLLVDLGELLNRHASQGRGEFWISDLVLAALPPVLSSEMIRLIADRVASILRNPDAGSTLRTSAAFVLGKTFDPAALAAVARVVASLDVEPGELARQLGFAFDVLWAAFKPGDPPIDLDAVAQGFRRIGVPWDDVAGNVLADEI